MTRQEMADRLHDSGCNCAQAVALAFADCTEMAGEDIFKSLAPFGAGMGAMNGVCGALSGAAMIAGLLRSDGVIGATETKKECYQLAGRMQDMFREKAGSIICREIKGVGTGTPLYACSECIRTAVAIACEVLDVPEEMQA